MRAGAFARVGRGLVWRPLVREPLRTLLTLAGIAVGVAVIVAIQLANRSALRSFGESVDAIAGRANWQIAADAGVLDERALLRLAPLWQRGARFAPVIDVEGALQPAGTPVRILGVDLMSDLHFRDYRWTRIATRDERVAAIGAHEEPPVAEFLALFELDSAILPETFAREQRLPVGAPLNVGFRDREARLRVRGILQSRGPATAFNGALVILDIAAAQDALGMRGEITRVDLILPEPIPADVRSFLERAMPPGARLERPSRRNERVDRMLRAFRVNLFALAAVALLVGMFLVYNTVTISILRRRRDIGVLKTLGVSSRQILAAFVGEGAVFGVVGSAAGVALGVALARGALDLVGATINQLYVASAPAAVRLTPATALAAIAIGTIVSIAAAMQPALEAARVRPSAMIRPGIYQRIPRARALRFAAASLVLLGAAWGLTRLPPFHGIPVWGYAAVVLVIAAFSLASPLSLDAASRAASRPFDGMFGVVGRLAAASIPASLRRTAIATAALTTAVAMMVSVAIMIGSFRDTVEAWVGQTVQSDLWVRPASRLSNTPTTTLPPELARELQAMPEVAAIDRYRGRDVVWRDSLITLGSGDFVVSQSFGSLPMIAPRSHAAALRDAIARRGILVSETLALKHDLRVGRSVALPTPRGAVAFPIAGIYRDYSNDRGVAVMDRSLWTELFGEEGSNTIAVFLAPGISPEEGRRAIEARIAARYRAFVFTNATIRAEVMRIFDQTFLITWALLAVALAVAVLGIVNTLTALILERRRELALLRVLGMERREVGSMIVLEACVIGASSTLLGLVAGWILSWILIFVINRQSFGWTIEFDPPWGMVFLSLLATFAATVAAGLLPARLAQGVRMAAELKGE
ncbi:MAG TPA: FtsX-like permease family protein [Thermoanaerobaculia bacterium]